MEEEEPESSVPESDSEGESVPEPVDKTREEKVERDDPDAEEPSEEDLSSVIPDEIIPDDVDAENAETLLMAQLQRHSGPLPHPDTLADYKEISSQAIDWIFDAATKEQDYRHWCNKEPLRQSRRAQNFAFTIAILVILVGAFLVYEGKSVEGLVAIMVPLATILGIFIYREVQGINTLVRSSGEEREDD